MTTPHASHSSRTAYVLFIWGERRRTRTQRPDGYDLQCSKRDQACNHELSSGPQYAQPQRPTEFDTWALRVLPILHIRSIKRVPHYQAASPDQAAGLQESLQVTAGGRADCLLILP